MKKPKRPALAKRLKRGLAEGVRFAHGDVDLSVTVVPVGRTYTGRQVAAIRKKRKLTQAQFARLLAVHVKTVQSWEQGARKPSGPTMRLLQVFDEPEAFRPMFASLNVQQGR